MLCARPSGAVLRRLSGLGGFGKGSEENDGRPPDDLGGQEQNEAGRRSYQHVTHGLRFISSYFFLVRCSKIRRLTATFRRIRDDFALTRSPRLHGHSVPLQDAAGPNCS